MHGISQVCSLLSGDTLALHEDGKCKAKEFVIKGELYRVNSVCVCVCGGGGGGEGPLPLLKYGLISNIITT